MPSSNASSTNVSSSNVSDSNGLSPATLEAIRAEIALYPHKKTALLPSLKLAQKEKGWLSKETLAQVADLVGLPHSHAIELASFYSMLFTHEVAPTRVEMCVQLPCALVGADKTLAALAERLGIELHGQPHQAHGKSKDGKIELGATIECYGSCHRAPMCRVGDEYVENLKTDADLDRLAQRLKSSSLKSG